MVGYWKLALCDQEIHCRTIERMLRGGSVCVEPARSRPTKLPLYFGAPGMLACRLRRYWGSCVDELGNVEMQIRDTPCPSSSRILTRCITHV